MSHCCNHNVRFDGVSKDYKRRLLIVIFINAVMFIVEMSGGLLSGSVALRADALDFLADTLTYGMSLWVIGKPLKFRATAALVKGVSLFIIAIWVIGVAIYNMFYLETPVVYIMSWVAVLAFLANIVSALLLVRYKDGDANVRSVWLCSRNDAIGNVVILIAASAVWYTNSGWPDLIVALFMSSLFLSSSWKIIKQALDEMKDDFSVENKIVDYNKG